MNMRHSNCAVSTDPFHLISDSISHYLCSDFTLEQHQILYNCYNVVFLFHSFLVCAEKNHNFIYFDKMVFPLCKKGTPSDLEETVSDPRFFWPKTVLVCYSKSKVKLEGGVGWGLDG